MRVPIALLLFIATAGLARDAGSSEENAPALAGLKVLVVSAESGEGAWIEEILEKHGALATVCAWSGAGVEEARKFDLVVVTGRGRRAGGPGVVLGYDRPVLGIGPYGHGYFGLTKLKHGSPHS